MKMKRLVILLTGLVILSGLMFAQTITVTEPAAGANWCRGSSHDIRWTKTGTQDDQVKIRLFDSTGTNKILDITNDTPNDGSFSWPIPVSVAAGRYVIRVKTLDNLVTDDSGVFNITVCDRDSATITVTEPAVGVNWLRGSTKTIRWTKTGTQDTRVKIRLYNPAGTTKIMDIVENTENDGQFDWPIPGSADGGQYLVRVKTLDNEVYDDSSIFNITTFRVFIPGVVVPQDLEALGVRFIFNRGGWIVLRIKSVINTFNADVKFRYAYSTPAGATINFKTERINLVRGGEKDIYLKQVNASDLARRPMQFSAKIDPDNTITETNEDNNSAGGTLTLFDAVNQSRRSDVQVSRLYGHGGEDYRIKFKIRVSHNSDTRVENIKYSWRLERVSNGAEIKTYDGDMPAIDPGRTGEKQITETYGKSSRRNAKHPRLVEGRQYRVVCTISTGRGGPVDTISTNNRFAFSFTLDK